MRMRAVLSILGRLVVLVLLVAFALPVVTSPAQAQTGSRKVFQISMVSYMFTPSLITVNRGDTVVLQFSNDDPDRRNHSIASRLFMRIEPKATGAVLPMRASPAASSGRKPSPISIAPEIATGVPKPAAPSMNAPKLNAIRSAWMRRSSLSPAIVRFTISNWPVRTVTS